MDPVVIGEEGWAEAIPEDVREKASSLNTEQLTELLTKEREPGFFESLPEEVREHDVIKGYAEKPQEMVQALIDLHGKVPSLPESADDYKITVPEGFQPDNGMMTSFRKSAHKAGLSQRQVDAVSKWFFGDYADSLVAMADQQAKATMEELKGSWKSSFDQNVETAKRAAELVNKKVEGFTDWVDQSGLGDHPMFMKVFFEIGRLIAEDAFVEGGVKPPQQGIRRTETGQPMLQFEGEKFNK